MAFQFSLATVLRIRLLREEREERLLQRIFQEIAHAQRSIAEMVAEMQQASALRVAQVADPMAARDLILPASAAVALYECKRELEGQLERLEQLKDSQMAIYQAARRDRETISDLHAKRVTIHAASAALRQQKMLDDHFNARHHRLAGQHR